MLVLVPYGVGSNLSTLFQVTGLATNKVSMKLGLIGCSTNWQAVPTHTDG